MPVISESLANIGGAVEGEAVVFWTTKLRENDSGTGTTTKTRHPFYPVDGVLTTDVLDPGEAKVRIGMDTYTIVIPDTTGTIRLWPLLESQIPYEPPVVSAAVAARDASVAAAVRAEAAAASVPTLTEDPVGSGLYKIGA